MRLLISGSWVRAPHWASIFLLTTTDLLLQPYFQFLVGVEKKPKYWTPGFVVFENWYVNHLRLLLANHLFPLSEIYLNSSKWNAIVCCLQMTIDGFSSLLMTRSVRVLFEINLKTYKIFGPVWPGGPICALNPSTNKQPCSCTFAGQCWTVRPLNESFFIFVFKWLRKWFVFGGNWRPFSN